MLWCFCHYIFCIGKPMAKTNSCNKVFLICWRGLNWKSVDDVETISWRGLKAQKHLAQGNALGFPMHNNGAPCKGKSIKIKQSICWYYNAFALTGRAFHVPCKPRALPWARCFWALAFPSAADFQFSPRQRLVVANAKRRLLYDS